MIGTPQLAPPAIPKAAVPSSDTPAQGAALPSGQFAELLGTTREASTAEADPEKPTDPVNTEAALGSGSIDNAQELPTPLGVAPQKPVPAEPGQGSELRLSIAPTLNGDPTAGDWDEAAQEPTIGTEAALRYQGSPGAQPAALPTTPANEVSAGPMPSAEAVVNPGSPFTPVESATRTTAAPVAVSAPAPATAPAGSFRTLPDVAKPVDTAQLPTLSQSARESATAPAGASEAVRRLLESNQPQRAPSAQPLTRAENLNSSSAIPIEAASVTIAKAPVPGPDATQLRTLEAVLTPTGESDPEASNPVTPTGSNQQQPLAETNRAIVMDAGTSQAEPVARPSGEPAATGVAPTMSVRVDAPQAPTLAASPAQPLAVATPLPSAMTGQIQEMQQAGQMQRRVVIRLDPPELGTVRLELTKVGDDVLVAARAETAEAARAILRQLPEVRSAVEALGLSLSQFDVETPKEQDARHRFGQGSRHRAALAERDSEASGTEAERPPEEHNEGAIFL